MAKRQPLSFDNEELTKDLKQSAGSGIGAFFSSSSVGKQVPPPSEIYTAQKPIRKSPNPTVVSNKQEVTKKAKQKSKAITIPRNHATMPPRNHATMPPRYHDTVVEMIRKAVKELGKEAATHRFTVEEKKMLVDIVYSYKRQGIKTSENEITRIAVNFIVNDYKENGKNSVLEKALRALKE
jgi:hypothetical protein